MAHAGRDGAGGKWWSVRLRLFSRPIPPVHDCCVTEFDGASGESCLGEEVFEVYVEGLGDAR